ncbi:MAG: MazG family protein, partial [Verrucomicrobiia bacterium]
MSEIQRLRNIVTQLRAPDGCPWDREQTHQSLLRCLVEEVSEVLEAVDNNDFELMEEELGDLLLQVVMHACLAEEDKRFDLEDVARGISDKLIRRHPHVFGEKDERVETSGEVVDRWELIKAEEKKQKNGDNEKVSIFKNLPPRLPALLFANDIYKRVVKNKLEQNGDWSEKNAVDTA